MLSFSKDTLILSFSEVTLTSHRRWLTSTSGRASPFHSPPAPLCPLSTPIFIQSVPALPWNDITSQSCCSGNFPPLFWLSNPPMRLPKVKSDVFSFRSLSVVMWYGCHVCYVGSCTVILEDTGPIRGYGLHHSYGARTPIRVALLSCYEQADATIRDHHSTECQSMCQLVSIPFIASPNQRRRKTILKILFARSLIVNWIQSERDANLMGQMLVGWRQKRRS